MCVVKSKKGSKERQEQTLGVRFTEVFVKRGSALFKLRIIINVDAIICFN